MRMTTAKDLPKACFLCGRNGTTDPLDAHHIFGGANRKLSERYALVIPLCHDRCHENGKDAVHRNAAVAQAVHEFGQRLCMERMGWSIEEFRAVFGRNYLPEEPSGGPVSFQTGALAAGRNFPRDGEPSGGPVSFRRGKKSGKESRQREPIPRRFPLETLPDGQGGSAPIGSPCGGRETGDEGYAPIGSSFQGTGDEGRGFEILDEEVMPAWV